jgi:hypothetical protein
MTPQVWPVIHVRDTKTAAANARIAQACGCTGVFLISMHGDDRTLKPVKAALNRLLPGFKVGANFLSLDCDQAVLRSIADGYDATWADDAWQHTDIHQWSGSHPFFAAVAFKGSTYRDPHPDRTAREAVARGFIPMTSGSGTGVAASISKIAGLREALGPDAPLAMSGVDVSRMDELAPLVSHFLIATCISKDFYQFDEAMLSNFMTKMKGATS